MSEHQLRDIINKKDKQIRQLKRYIDSLNAELSEERMVSSSLKNSKEDRESEIRDLRNEISDMNQRFEAAKQHLKESYENVIQELKDQCEKYRSDVQKLSEQNAQADMKCVKLSSEVARQKKEKTRAEVELQSLKAQLERERRLNESTIRALKVQADATYNEKLEEQKAKAETEKRRILAMGVDAFRNFFNPTDQIDERSFRNVMDRAKERIAQLTQSDLAVRQMLGAGERQTTPDAVAQLLMTHGK